MTTAPNCLTTVNIKIALQSKSIVKNSKSTEIQHIENWIWNARMKTENVIIKNVSRTEYEWYRFNNVRTVNNMPSADRQSNIEQSKMKLFYFIFYSLFKHKPESKRESIRILYANVIQFLFLIRSYLNEMLKGVSTFQVHALLVSFILFSSHFVLYT